MKRQSALYLISLTPPQETSNYIKQLKLQMAQKMSSPRSMPLLEHIAIKAPFFYSMSDQENLVQELKRFSRERFPNVVNLNGFGVFPDRSIYLRLLDAAPLRDMHVALGDHLENTLQVKYNRRAASNYKPYIPMTFSATPGNFHKVWPQFRNKKFETKFVAQGLHLYRYDRGEWTHITTAAFNPSGYTLPLFKEKETLNVKTFFPQDVQFQHMWH